MKTHSNSDKIAIGRGYGEEILYAVTHAKKSVKIVSPYLSGTYLDELVSLNKKGINITLITSDNLTEQDSKYAFDDSKIIKQEKIPIPEAKQKRKNRKIASLAFFLVSLFTLTLSAFFFPIIFLAALLFIVSLLIFVDSYFIKECSYKYHSIFRLKVFDSKSGDKPWSTNLIHSKIFIIDDAICYLGSANFTWSGFKTHYETVIKVEDEGAINDISQEVESLFNSTALKAKDIQEWGQEIYGE